LIRRGTFKLQIQPARLIRALSLSSSRRYYRKTATSWWTAAILGVVPYLNVPDPGCFKMIGDFASIGLGFGAALGVAKARPDKTTVLIVGDGGFLMTMGELETVVREDLPIVIVLMNDCAYGAELHFLRLRQQPVTKSVFPDVDFAPMAESFDFEAATIRTLDDLHKLAAKLRKPDGPIFLDCKINADVAAPFMSEFAQFEGRH
jgi:thiamine pyrophosphate-dependent acetolactate synthase large subunit-like protein